MILEEERFLFHDLPKIICPTCHKGTLSMREGSLIQTYPSWINLLPDIPSSYFDEDGNERRTQSLMDVEGTDYEEFVTTFFLECGRKYCKEVISTCGVVKQCIIIVMDDDGDRGDLIEDYYFPKYFYPSIRLFEIPEKTPTKIVDELEVAFSLFWSNPSASGNSMRKAIERIMDEIAGIPSTNDSLHKRIENLGEGFSSLKEPLLASKWIGNDGSHQSDLTHDDVILGFEFIELCLIELYNNSGRDLNSLARKINIEKKPFSKLSN